MSGWIWICDWALWTTGLFFVSGHVPPLLRNFEHLFLEVGVGHLSSTLLTLSRLAAVLVGFGCQDRPPSVRYMPNIAGEESFLQIRTVLNFKLG
jgi:hypothetical protein